MGAKDERMLMQKFMDYGFGAYRYPQPAITIKDKYQRPDFTKVRRAQPVDFFVNGKLHVTFEDGTERTLFLRIGVEEKTTSGFSYTRSQINDKSHVKFIEFCRVNCVLPAYIIVFRRTEYVYKFGFHIGNDKPYSIRHDEAYIQFDEFLEAFIREYLRLYEDYDALFDTIEVDLRGE